MAIGDSTKYLHENKFMKMITSSVGTGLHDQTRIKPLTEFTKQNFNNKPINILEIGCGNGINAFELYKINNNIKYHGYDLNLNVINAAQKIANEMGCDNKIKFKCEDATTAEFDLEEEFDIILLIDFLEHIDEPETFLKSIINLLNEKTIIIVSVPTYNYMKFFGEEFHKEVGHVKDGYTISELTELFEKIGYKNDAYSYNTGYISNIGCYLYNKNLKNNYLNSLKVLLLYPFKFFDIYNSENVSCSLFAVFSRRKK